ncbi:hypothetical protein TRFO_23438 [Tritrichomonas foetus]|uniref:Uncharacterized protein n=1 Tax=Tritrichomonas foetus TaxID=1144522 RepID=A0A1J4KB16_9EUKA|nr:hypothetical protein TRFO_23438 [Tritrichomonas foetus]|eukprot:OHT08154.1 hypothetical protein TRFO_23438 [Tritrichomonas foetus]
MLDESANSQTSSEVINDRYDQVVEYLRESIEHLVNSKLISPNKKRRVDASYVSSRLVDVLKNALASEREAHLEELMLKLSRMNTEKENLDRELIQIKGSTERETLRYTHENEELQKQFAAIEEELKTIEWRQSTKEAAYKADLKQKQTQLQSLKKVIDTSHQIQQNLSQEASNLRNSVLKMQRNQVRLIRRAKELCKEKLNESIEFETQQQNFQEAQQIRALQNTLLKEKAEYRKNQRVCQTLLNAIWAISNEPHPDITPETFTQKIPELKQFIQNALDFHRENAIAELKAEVRKQIPDIQLGNENVVESVQRYISNRIQEKDIEYQRILKRGEEREKRLKQKLQEALTKIEKYQESDESSSNDEEIISDFEKMKDEWDMQKRQLDEKMKMLRVGTSSISSSHTNLK